MPKKCERGTFFKSDPVSISHPTTCWSHNKHKSTQKVFILIKSVQTSTFQMLLPKGHPKQIMPELQRGRGELVSVSLPPAGRGPVLSGNPPSVSPRVAGWLTAGPSRFPLGRVLKLSQLLQPSHTAGAAELAVNVCGETSCSSVASVATSEMTSMFSRSTVSTNCLLFS